MKQTLSVGEENRVKKNKTLDYIKRFWPLYVMLLPLLIYLAIFNYYPMTGIQLAFKDYVIRKGIWGSPWATDAQGNLDLLKNFKELFAVSQFSTALKNTLRISFLKLLIGTGNYIIQTQFFLSIT